MRAEICAHCISFRPNDKSTGVGGGICTRFPPVPMLMPKQQPILGAGTVGMAGVNPPVNDAHTCREFKDSKPLAIAG